MLAPDTNKSKTHTVDHIFLALAKLLQYGDSDKKTLECSRFPILITDSVLK